MILPSSLGSRSQEVDRT